jgi:hypothetical protein
MAAFDFSPAQAAASMAEGQQASVPIQSLLMQIDADAVFLVRTQFQHITTALEFHRQRTRLLLSAPHLRCLSALRVPTCPTSLRSVGARGQSAGPIR